MGDYDEPSGPRLHGIPNLDWPGTYDEEIGTRQSFPEINAQIRRQLGLEARIDPTKIVQAVRTFKSTETGEYISKKEMLKKLTELKAMGIPVAEVYHGLKSYDLNRFFRNMQAKVYTLARNSGFDPMAIV